MPKKIPPLSDPQIKKAKYNPDKTLKDSSNNLFDGGGLYVLLTESGGKLWRLKYRYLGKEKLMALGIYPDVSLEQARARRLEARKLLAEGVDPQEFQKTCKSHKLELLDNTFEKVAREWHHKFTTTGKWSSGHSDDVLHRLEKDIFPPLGSRPISELKAKELLEALECVASRGAVDTAHRLLCHCGMIFRYAVVREMASRDITVELTGELPPVKGGNYAAFIAPDDVRSLLIAIDEYKGSIIVKRALQLLPLLFCRPGELRAAEWSELDLDNAAMWDVPAERMKMKKPHFVPLSKQAINLLKSLQPLTGAGKYVFPSLRSPLRCMSDNAYNAALRRMGYSVDEVTAHGFRATADTMLQEQLKFPEKWIEIQLSHATKAPNGTAYDRTSFLPERIDMMQRWSDYLDGLKAGAKIIPISKAA